MGNIDYIKSSLTDDHCNQYDWIRDNILRKIPNNPEDDKAFLVLSTHNEASPIMSYKKGIFTILYRLDKPKRIVYIQDVEIKKDF